MTQVLTFFPSSLPDESLLSRISRYHLLTGNKTISNTYVDLFDKKPFPLEQIVPTSIEVLAGRLGGERRERLKELLLENTLLPLFLPYLGTAKSEANSDVSSEIVSHIPRRVVGMHGEAQLCLECVKEDAAEFGVPYLHRSHQIPGVTACWKHRKKLLSCCPICACPFLFSRKLLSIPWQSCRCGWSPDLDNTAYFHEANPHAYEYAFFANKLLNKNIVPLAPESLLSIYKNQAIQLGFSRGTNIAIESLKNEIIEYFGVDFIKDVDSAFDESRTRGWLRFASYHSSLDMPITRHILIGLFLFKDVDSFYAKTEKEREGSVVNKSLAVGAKNDYVNVENSLSGRSAKKVHRDKILKLKQKNPLSPASFFWKQSISSMSWLYDNDHSWLEKNILQSESEPPLKVDASESNKEILLAEKIESYGKGYYDENTGKPERLTIGRLLGCIKLSSQGNPKSKFPLIFEKIDQYTESVWHFRARRIIWSIKELKRSGELLSTSNIALVSGVNFSWVNNILDHTGWDLETLAQAAIDSRVLLLKSGMAHNWAGPLNQSNQNSGGRRHSSQIKFESKSYLDLILMRQNLN